MDNEKRAEDRVKYSGRFGDGASTGSQRPTGSFRSQPAGSYRSRPGYQEASAARRPSGFGTIGQEKSDLRRAAPTPKPPEPEAPKKKKREKHAKEERPSREHRSRPGLKILLIVLAGAAVLLLILVLVFGGKGTFHQLPTVERETSASFAPDATPIPGAEVP